MKELKTGELIKQLSAVFNHEVLDFYRKEIALRRSFNEAWFSDTLAWLLDPRGSHMLGVKFANEFLSEIAKERSNKKRQYKHRESYLKHGKSGRGHTARGFSLKNASSIRELYLPNPNGSKGKTSGKFADVVLVDLDTQDGLIVVIENKLFTSNHPGQLTEYLSLTNEKFTRAKVREFVYLTLDGVEPRHLEVEKDADHWVRLSWSSTILSIVQRLSGKSEHEELDNLKNVLNWVHNMKRRHHEDNGFDLGSVQQELMQVFLRATVDCLGEELRRLNSDKAGEWSEPKGKNKKLLRLTHSSAPTKELQIELLNNLTITAHTRRRGDAFYEKIIVPFGVHPDQIFNLMDIAARDIFYGHFGQESVKRYLSDKRRLTKTQSEAKAKHKPLFEFLYKYQHELKVMLALNGYLDTKID